MEFGPNYHKTFELCLPGNKDEVTLKVHDQRNPEVWKYKVDLEAPRRKHLERNLPAERDNMSVADLIKLLEDLTKDDFEKFKWYLKNEKLGDIEPIKESQLEDAKMQKVVDLMVQKYELAGAVEVMKSVLKKINRNNLVKKLPNISSGAAGPGAGAGAGAGAGPGPGAGPTVTPSVSADKQLLSVRAQFIGRVSEPNLNMLLGKLLEQGFINDGEMESLRVQTRAEKAEALIDMVRRKGAGASSALIAALCEVDPEVSKQLKLQ
ncbi:uncharacterized protein LOC128382149 isoform X2 [Scomber japonicus]|uniref:uncharacterized protein LOC128382149 isoform X2 n=1 Tax=Scomber japonicus TaxID=13676 RepID=UPI002305488A|nr:uncharacterized protein LOC128382149 isoform X2 [Scomber japonicus]